MPITVYTKDEVDVLLGEQATWGTALADSTNFNGTTAAFGEIVDCEITELDWDAKERLPNRSNSGQRQLMSDNIQMDQRGSSPKYIIKGDAKKHTLAHLLYAVMQNVTEDAAAGVFEKTYTFPAQQPDLTAGAGWFGTMILKQPIASQSQKVKDIIVPELVLSCDPNNNQGRLSIDSCTLMGRGAPVTNSNPTGTLARYSQTFFYFNDINVFTGNGNTFTPMSFQIKISNGARPVGVDTASLGDFRTYALGIPYSVELKMTVLHESAAVGLQVLQGTKVDHPWVIGWGTDNTNGYLNFAVRGQLVKSPDVYVNGVKCIEFNVKGVYVAPSTQSLTVVLADGLDRAW
jgi:hypothetical protein